MSKPDLSVQLCDRKLRNPVVTASGTFGYGKEYSGLVRFEQLGGITVKGVSPFPSHGNNTPRTSEVDFGMINSIGLQNPGIDKFIAHPDYLPFLRTLDTAVYVNIWGKTMEDYAEVASRLQAEREGIAGLEINISCPNIKEGGMSFGTSLELAGKVVNAVRQATDIPLITKLSPNVNNIADFARCVVDNGSDMVSLINTFPSMAIDIYTRKPKIAANFGGLSGPGIKPISIKMIYEVSQAVDVPIIGMGGIFSAADAIEFLLAGATAVAVGTAIFSDPQTPIKVIQGIADYLNDYDIKDINDIIGGVEIN